MNIFRWVIVIGVALVVSMGAHAYLASCGMPYMERVLLVAPLSILTVIGMRFVVRL